MPGQLPGQIAPQGGGALYPPEDVEAGKIWAILGYLISPLWIIPLVQRDNAFALYHAKQALGYTVAVFVAMVPIMVIGWLTCGIGFILLLPFFYPWLIGLLNALNGKYEPMPWIGTMADQQLASIVADKRPGSPGAMPR